MSTGKGRTSYYVVKWHIFYRHIRLDKIILYFIISRLFSIRFLDCNELIINIEFLPPCGMLSMIAILLVGSVDTFLVVIVVQ